MDVRQLVSLRKPNKALEVDTATGTFDCILSLYKGRLLIKSQHQAYDINELIAMPCVPARSIATRCQCDGRGLRTTMVFP